MKIFIASSEKYVGKIQEDMYIRDAYREAGVSSEIAALTEIAHTATYSDVVIIKSIWGYHTDHNKFLAQLNLLKENGVKLVNDYRHIEWNMDKSRYLKKIGHLKTVPTLPLNLDQERTAWHIEDIIHRAGKELGSDELVVKPCISASGHLTIRYNANKKYDKIISLLQENKDIDFIAQPFRGNLTKGEISIVVLDGTCLYGIRRFPGVFGERSEPEYIELTDVPPPIQAAATVLHAFFEEEFGNAPTICRIDFLEIDTDYEILEVELIDPDLFLRHIPESVREKAVYTIINSLKFHV